MWLSDVSVKRPTLAIVLTLLLCVFGYISFTKLAVREMPDIDNPVVSIMTRYDGASASVLESQVTTVLEEQLSGISGIDEITSTTRTGISRITVTFDVGYDINLGISDIRDAISRATKALPDDASEPTIARNNGSGETSLDVNISSNSMTRTELTDYVNRVLLDRFTLISGVSTVQMTGGLDRVMYVDLKPDKMAGLHITARDITQALRAENLESPAGEIKNNAFTMSVRVAKGYATVEDFTRLVVGYTNQSEPIYLGELADINIGAKNADSLFRTNGVPNVSLGIISQTGANPLEVAEAVSKEVERIQSFLPKGVKVNVDYDSTVFIKQSVNEVYTTFAITGILVMLVLYLFLGQFQAMLIPALTVPVSIIASFTVAHIMGYSINLITLMALILAIGLVVDDAIVVVENMFHHLESGETPLVSAYKGTREVGFAVVSTTLVLVCVFLPITFMEGIAGLLFTEFAVMLSVAVLFSSLIALTLTPVLGSKWLSAAGQHNQLTSVVNRLFDALSRAYKRSLRLALSCQWVAPLVIIACVLGSYGIGRHVPQELAPSEDRGLLFAFVKGADATGFERMGKNMAIIEKRLQPLVGKGFLKSFSIQTPAFGGNAGDETGFVTMMLEDWSDREVSSTEALGEVKKVLANIADVKVFVFAPGFRGRSSEPVQFILAGSSYDELNVWAERLKVEAESSGIMDGVDINFSEKTPELVVNIDKVKAAELGVTVDDISETLEVMLGGKSETTYTERGREYDVYLKGQNDSFDSAADLSKIYIRSKAGELVSLDTVASISEVGSATRYEHYDKKKAITLSANVLPDHTLGEALEFLNQKAKAQLPNDISVYYSGQSKDFYENQSSTAFVFMLSLLVVYLILAAQFESFVNPLVVMLTVPMGLVGGFIGLWIMGQGMNIYSQIGMLMLIGLVTKNGILIVEFANQLRAEHMAFEKAIIEASARRLRPILMTTVTTLAGAVPLILSTGAGYESRVAVGSVIFFGMAVSTIITLYVIPMMYGLLSKNTKAPNFIEEKLNRELELNPSTPNKTNS